MENERHLPSILSECATTGEPHREKKKIWFVPNFILPQSLVVQQRTHSISKCCETCQRPVPCHFSSVLGMRKKLGRAREGAGLTCPGPALALTHPYYSPAQALRGRLLAVFKCRKETGTCACSHPPPLFPCTGSAGPSAGSLQV